MNIQLKSQEKSLQQNEGHLPLVPYCRYMYVCIHFLSHSSHMNSFTQALPWNLDKT